MTATASISKFAKLLVDTSGASFSSGSTPLVFNSEGIKATKQRVEDEGLRGSRSRYVYRVADGLIPVAGPITCEPSPGELDFWLPFILGGSKSGNNIPVAEALTAKAFGIKKDPNTGKWFQYDGCVPGSAEFASDGPGKKLRLTTNILGATETVQSASFPAVAYDTEDVYMHHQVVLTLGGSISAGVHTGGTSYLPERASIKIDNAVQVKYRNSQSAIVLIAGDRIVDVSFTVPFTADELALYTNGNAAIAGSLVWTMAGYSLGFYFPNLKCQIETPVVPGGVQEVTLPLTYRAYRDNTNAEIDVYNDSNAGT